MHCQPPAHVQDATASRTQTENGSRTPGGARRTCDGFSDLLARTPYGEPDGTWSFPWAAKGAMKT
eukprot:scaffold70136_cov55-Phaeocystis_antarctica.AAC.4